MTDHISVSQWITFNVRWLKGEFPNQRFGQAFCNEFNFTNPNVFYEEDHVKVVNVCLQTYVDMDNLGANTKSPNAVVVPKEKLDKIIPGNKLNP